MGDFEAKNLPVIVIGQSGCYFPVIAALLSDLEILNSELGRLALSTAIVMDSFNSIVTGIGTAFVSSLPANKNGDDGSSLPKALLAVFYYFCFMIVTPLVVRPILKWFVSRTPEGRPVKKVYTYIVFTMALAIGMLGLYTKQSILGGICLLGIIVPEGPPLGTEMIKQLELFCSWFLFPIFVTSCAMKVDLSTPIKNDYIYVWVGFIVAIHLFKMLVTTGICWYCNIPIIDGLCLALMLSCKGVVDFCTNFFLHDAKVISLTSISIHYMPSCMHDMKPKENSAHFNPLKRNLISSLI